MHGPVETRHGFRATILPVVLALVLLASACRQRGTGDCLQGSDPAPGIRGAAEQAIRTASPKLTVQFKGVHVYAQAAEAHWAVCGLMTPFADDPGIFVPFVSVVARATRGARPEIRQSIASTTAEADRVYIALVTDCWDGGGPSTGPLQAMTPLPPLPDTVREPSARGPLTAAPRRPSPLPARPDATATETIAPAAGTVTMRQNANLHASPHGAPVRVVQQGATLRIFAAAPGGWYQVGDTSPWGWVHESMIRRQ